MEKAQLILEAVCGALNVSASEVQTESRKAPVIEAGYIATKIMFDANISPKDIHEVINRCRTNIYYRLEICENRINLEPAFKQKYLHAKTQTHELLNEINGRTSKKLV